MRNASLLILCLLAVALAGRASATAVESFDLDEIVEEPYPTVDLEESTSAEAEDDEEDDTALGEDDEAGDAEDELDLARNPDAVEFLEDFSNCSQGDRASCSRWKAARRSCRGRSAPKSAPCGRGRSRCACKAVRVAWRIISARGAKKTLELQKRVRLLATRYNQLRRAFNHAATGRGLVPKRIRKVVENLFDRVRETHRGTRNSRRGHAAGWRATWLKWGWRKQTADEIADARRQKRIQAREAAERAEHAKFDAKRAAAARTTDAARAAADKTNSDSAAILARAAEQSRFDRFSLQGQLLAEATCTALNPGGWTFAVRRECSSSARSCDQICNGITEGQAGGLGCFNALHIYDNQPANAVARFGLKVYKYNSCAGSFCGPNYCCCKQRSFEETEALDTSDEEDKSLEDDLELLDENDTENDKDEEESDDDDDDEEEDNNDLEEALPNIRRTGFDSSSVEGQVLAQATCVALNTAGLWTYAVRRECGNGADCATVCRSLTEVQGGRLQAFNSLHLYGGNVAASTTHVVGLKTYKYNAVGGGCGPNYCCCRGAGTATEEEEATEDIEQEVEVAQPNGSYGFDRDGMDGQIQAEAACAALAPNSSSKGGWSYAVRRDCRADSAQTCDQLCGSMVEAQAQSNGNSRSFCINSIHIYNNQPHSSSSQVGLKTFRHNSCSVATCGPNFCCCWNGHGGIRP